MTMLASIRSVIGTYGDSASFEVSEVNHHILEVQEIHDCILSLPSTPIHYDSLGGLLLL